MYIKFDFSWFLVYKILFEMFICMYLNTLFKIFMNSRLSLRRKTIKVFLGNLHAFKTYFINVLYFQLKKLTSEQARLTF